MTAAPKPIVLISGNCQAQFLAAAVRYSDVAEAYYIGGDWQFLQSYRGCFAAVLPPDTIPQWVSERRDEGRRVILAVQNGPLVSPAFALKIDPSVAHSCIRFPALSQWAMSRERFLHKFRAPYTVERMYELDMEANETAQVKSDFPIDAAGIVDKESRTRPLFNTTNHPGGFVYSLLLFGLAELLDPETDCSELRAVGEACADEEILNYQTDHPVDPEIRRALGWEWGREYELFSKMLRATAEARWNDLERDLPEYGRLFSANTQFWRCRARLGLARRSDEIAIPALDKIIDLCPGVPGPWLLYAQHIVRTKGRSGLGSLLERAGVRLANTPVLGALQARMGHIVDP